MHISWNFINFAHVKPKETTKTMEKIVSLARQIENLNIELLNSIKAEISKVNWKTENTKSLIFENPLPYFEDFGDEHRVIFIHEISNVSENKNSLSYHYKTDGSDNRMFKSELWVDTDEGLNLLYNIAKHLENTNVYEGHILRYDSSSERLGLRGLKKVI